MGDVIKSCGGLVPCEDAGRDGFCDGLVVVFLRKRGTDGVASDGNGQWQPCSTESKVLAPRPCVGSQGDWTRTQSVEVEAVRCVVYRWYLCCCMNKNVYCAHIAIHCVSPPRIESAVYKPLSVVQVVTYF